MTCKIVVYRESRIRSEIGDAISAHEVSDNLGDQVQKVGGAFVVIEFIDAKKNHPTIIKLTQEWLINGEPHPDHERKFYLQPIAADDPFFAELFATNHLKTTINKADEYLRERF